MKYATFLIIFVLSNTAIGQDCLLSGEWVSNEEMTLTSMNSSGKINEKQRKLLSSDFFGKLKLTYTCNSVTSLFEGQSRISTYELVRNENGGFIMKSIVDDVKYDQEIWFTDDNRCYYSVVGKLNFNEYFCKSN